MLGSALVAAGLAAGLAQGQVVGSPTGFATGVTGGGDATPAAPSDIAELKEWLSDDTPRVILIDKEFNFIGSEGSTTEDGCRPDSNTCPGNGGQDAIDVIDWCSADYPAVEVTYDNAGMSTIDVGGDKSIVGVGDAGVIRGKGLRLTNDVSNIIIQNVHITEINPEYIWGGDALTLTGTDRVWIDHVTTSLIGRQMLVTGYDQAGKVTVSNCFFNGTTSWSASCNNDHYWTVLLLGEADQISFTNNHIYHTSGRGPKVGGNVTLHAVNNYWESVGGHAFDISEEAKVLIEGNVFESVDTPITAATADATGVIFNVPSGSEGTCADYLGRDCVANTITDSGEFADYTDTEALSPYTGLDTVLPATSADDVIEYVNANAGFGKLSSTTSSEVAPVKAIDTEPATSSAAASTSSTAPTSTSTTATVAATSEAATTSAAASSGETIKKYYQCGGKSWTGSGSCEEGTECQEANEWYSQCL